MLYKTIRNFTKTFYIPRGSSKTTQMQKKNFLKRSYKPVIKEGDMGKNPFVSGDFIISVTKRRAGYNKKHDGNFYEEVYNAERETKCVMYTKSVNRKLVCSLSSAAMPIYLYVSYVVDYGKDWLWLNKSACMVDCGIKAEATFKKGVDELIKKGVLCLVHGYTDVYWTNPVLFFNGSRVKSFPDNVRIDCEMTNGRGFVQGLESKIEEDRYKKERLDKLNKSKEARQERKRRGGDKPFMSAFSVD